MISEKSFTRGSAACLQHQQMVTHAFLTRMQTTKIIDWDELVSILATNKTMLGYAASELDRVGKNKEAVASMEQKVLRFRQSREG